MLINECTICLNIYTKLGNKINKYKIKFRPNEPTYLNLITRYNIKNTNMEKKNKYTI